MRKRIITQSQPQTPLPDSEWMNLNALAEVEVSSEEATRPIEFALLPCFTSGWRAAGPGRQVVRLIFERPQQITRIRLVFDENEVERTQEYVLRRSSDAGETFQDIVRQQWNFSPLGSSQETEEYRVDLPPLNVLELEIVPDIGGGDTVATLSQLRLN